MFFWTAVAIGFITLCLFGQRVITLYALTFITIISAFRFQVGSDFNSYWSMFDIISRDIPHLWQDKEIGYLSIIRLVALFGGNQQVVVILFAVLTTMLSYSGLRYFTKGFEKQRLVQFSLLVVFIFHIYYPSLNQIRQYFVLGLFIYSLKYYIQSKYYIYCGLMLLATTIHVSAFIVLLASMFISIDMSKRRYIYVLILAVLIMNPVSIFVDLYVSYTLPYYQYFTIVGLAGKSSAISVFSSYLMSILFIVMIFFGKKQIYVSIEYRILVNLSFLFIVIKLVGADFEIINRVSNYFKIFFYIHFLTFVFSLKFKESIYRTILIFSAISLVILSGLFSVVLRASIDPTYSNVDFNLCVFSEHCSLKNY